MGEMWDREVGKEVRDEMGGVRSEDGEVGGVGLGVEGLGMM